MSDPLRDFLQAIDLERHVTLFVENEVDFATLQLLTDDDLKELGLPFGPRKRLINALNATRQPATPIAVARPDGSADDGERRQLTVLFCDMVGFTELAHRIDPEQLKSIIRQYEDACTACIQRFDGYVFTTLGDGVVAFFGFPLAHEGEAERAVRAALAILDEMASFNIPGIGQLQVRIGIATGMVVVSAGERNAVGETMNLASRLQGVARPGGIAISDRVRRLAGSRFVYEDLGDHELKGIAEATRVFGVRGLSSVTSRFDAAMHSGVAPLVGRDFEIRLMIDQWEAMRADGMGRAVIVSGEPGIGKSRIIRAFSDQLEAQGAQPLLFQCSQFYSNSAFYPIVAALEYWLELDRDVPVATRLDRIEAMVVDRLGLPVDDVRFIARLLSLPVDRYRPLAMSPQLIKSTTIRVLVDLVAAMAREQPRFLLFEDAHWADPTTIEVLTRIIDHLADIPLLFVLTHRPEFVSPWSHHAAVRECNLNKLAAAQSRALIEGLAGNTKLPAELVTRIVGKADGVPLFVEELTRAIIESGQLDTQGSRYVLTGSLADVTIPDTLRDSLTARLDRVASIKQVAQIGSAIGREFSYELIAALEVMPPHDLAVALTQLTASGLATARGSIPEAVYTFKHALVQDTAYDSLLRSQRKPLHARIAQTIEERWPETRETEPELLAHHYTAAGLIETAVPLWRHAGEVAMQRFALPEAVSHLTQGMDLLESLPQTPERDLAELTLRTVLGPATVARRGWGHPEVSEILEPAWALAEALDHRASYLPILNALWVHFMCRDQLAVSLYWAQQLLDLGASQQDDSLAVVGHRAASASHYWLGNFDAAFEHGEQVHAIYDAERHWHVAQLTNTDPFTGEGIYRAQYLWMLGYPDRALAATLANEAHAHRRNHPFDLAFALTLGAQAFDHRCEPDELLRRTKEAEHVGREFGVALLWEVMAEISRGVALMRAGELADSIELLDRAIARLAATGHRVWIAYLHAVRAEAMALLGDLAGANTVLDASLARIAAGEERAHYAEVMRIKGWVMMQQGEIETAEKYLRAAIAVARSQNARSWELRATTTLAELLAARGEPAKAHAALSAIHGWFTEGHATRDLRNAARLLATLDPPVDDIARIPVEA